MGGRETVRGILVQALICCDEMFEKQWEIVKFEPIYSIADSEEEIEKVDILFSNTKKQTYALQVKSSINRFSETKIVRWITDIRKDIRADFYELHLVGKCDEKTTAFIENNNQTGDTKIICKSFDIDRIEYSILEKARRFLNSKNIGWKSDTLKNKIKILCYDVFKNALDDKFLSLEYIMTLLTSSDNSDVKSFCQLIRDRLLNRINIILEFYKSTYLMFGFGTEDSRRELLNNIIRIRDIDNQYETRIGTPLQNIKDNEQYYFFLCNEYLEKEKKSISVFLEGLNTPQDYYHKQHNTTYHLNLRQEINKLITSYNIIDITISEKYYLQREQKDVFENQDDIQIQYSDFKELEEKLQTLAFKEQKHPIIMGFTDERIKLECLERNITGCCQFLLLGEYFKQEDMFNHVVVNNEAFTEDGSFSPQLYVRYMIFLLSVSDNIRSKLEKFKSRSTIKYIFVKEIQLD